MRLDKFLCEMNIGTRSQVKDLLKKKLVCVNGTIVVKPETHIDETKDIIAYQGKTLSYQKYYYFMLNKPQGVVSATEDSSEQTVLDLLKDENTANLFPVGRLDKDTEGLLILTNNGELSHKLLSPKKHVDKTYLVTIKSPLNEEAIQKLEKGVDIGEDKLTLPAKVDIVDDKHIYLTIHEGKFHQVKRMLQAVDNCVTALKRTQFGPIPLDETLLPGQYRPLTDDEIFQLEK